MNSSTRPHARTITVGIDGSLASRRAVCWAVDHARAGDTIVLVHAWRRTPNGTSDVVQIDGHAAAEHLVDHELGRARILASQKGWPFAAARSKGPSTPSSATAEGPMQSGMTRDAQLERSSNATYLAQLEQHQREIDQMLATGL
jgi:Universal stress protein family